MVAKRAYFRPPPLYTRITGIHPSFTSRWGPSAAVWGVGAGIYVLYILSATPLVRREVLSKVPLLGSYYEDHRPPSDRTS